MNPGRAAARAARICRRVLAIAAALPLAAAAQALTPHQQLARDIYRELVGIRTVHPDGDNTAAAHAMARRLLDAGFDPGDVQVLEPAPLKGNLVARLRGTGELKPLLLLAHLDVVDAKPEDWSGSLDPWKLTERDGHFYGRGTLDDKAMAAIFVANLIRARRDGRQPRRDVIVALTADEEGGSHNGVAWLLKEHRAKIDAELAINEGGGAQSRGGRPRLLGVQVSEKMYLSFELEATHPGGHSSLPARDNAIYDLAGALERVARMQLPARVGLVMRALAAHMAAVETGDLARSLAAIAAGNPGAGDLVAVSRVPRYNAQLRTTCVATRIEGGHADNALAQRARAIVNCRLLPGESEAFVRGELERAAGERVKVRARNALFASEASDARAPVMEVIRREAEAMWPGVAVMPIMSAGATDGSRLRNAGIPVYGVMPIFIDAGESRMHGRDERVPVGSFFDALEYLHRLVDALGRGS